MDTRKEISKEAIRAALQALGEGGKDISYRLVYEALGLKSEAEQAIVRSRISDMTKHGEVKRTRPGCFTYDYRHRPRGAKSYEVLWRFVRKAKPGWSVSECAMMTRVSYTQAVTAVRMSGIFHSEGEVHSYREYLLVRMLEDVPESRLKEYLEQFQVSGMGEVFADKEMTATAEEFLENSLNVSETSRNLFMHRNTLMYRLDKIERITGLNIRKFSDAVTFRVITILHKLLK